MSRQEMKAVIYQGALQRGCDLSPDQIKAYLNHLADKDPADVLEALAIHYRDEDTRLMPTVGWLRAKIAKLRMTALNRNAAALPEHAGLSDDELQNIEQIIADERAKYPCLNARKAPGPEPTPIHIDLAEPWHVIRTDKGVVLATAADRDEADEIAKDKSRWYAVAVIHRDEKVGVV